MRVRWTGAEQALVLGDGDGRFTARMMTRCGQMEVTAVDGSGKMLLLLRGRCTGMEARLHDGACGCEGGGVSVRVRIW